MNSPNSTDNEKSPIRCEDCTFWNDVGHNWEPCSNSEVLDAILVYDQDQKNYDRTLELKFFKGFGCRFGKRKPEDEHE